MTSRQVNIAIVDKGFIAETRARAYAPTLWSKLTHPMRRVLIGTGWSLAVFDSIRY
jgi:hypothetical protein